LVAGGAKAFAALRLQAVRIWERRPASLHRKVAGLLALEDAIDVACCLSELPGHIDGGAGVGIMGDANTEPDAPNGVESTPNASGPVPDNAAAGEYTQSPVTKKIPKISRTTDPFCKTVGRL
jgi:hypothetical protein